MWSTPRKKKGSLNYCHPNRCYLMIGYGWWNHCFELVLQVKYQRLQSMVINKVQWSSLCWCASSFCESTVGYGWTAALRISGFPAPVHTSSVLWIMSTPWPKKPLYGQPNLGIFAPFAWQISHGWKYCWLICYERKIQFVGWKSTAYKPSEQSE